MNNSRQASRRILATCILLGGMAAHGAAHAAFGTNLIVNAGAEDAPGGDGTFIADSLPGWSVSGEMTNIAYALGGPLGYPTETDPGPDDRGLNMFGGGYAGTSHATQLIDLGFAQAAVTGNGARFQLSGWLGGYASQNDYTSLSVAFLDANDVVVGSGEIGPVTAADRGNVTAMLYRQLGGWVPDGATQAVVDLGAFRTGGSSNDGYADSLGLTLLESNVLLDVPSVVSLGDSFAVTVSVLDPFGGAYTGDELLAFGFDLGFDTSVLALSGIVVEGWDDDTGLFEDVDVAGSAFPSIADEDQVSLSLATLYFDVVGLGDASIDVQSNYGGNLNHGLTYLNGTNVDLFGRVQVAAVPLPAAWLMFGTAAGLLAGRQRRRS